MKKIISDKVHLGSTELLVSPVGFGVLPMGPGQLSLSTEEGAKVLCYAIKRGINFIDTAQYYKTYPYIRRGLEILQKENPDLLDDIVICSKSLCSDYYGMMHAIEEACKELGRDYIDIFLLHEVRTSQFEERREAWRALNDAKRDGTVRAIGVSTHHVDVVAQMAEVKECDVIFALINYQSMGIRRGNCAATREEMLSAIGLCRSSSKGVFTMKALGGGNLTANYQKALNYVFSKKEIESVMIGFTSISEIDDIVSYLDGSMPLKYNPDVSMKKVRVNQEDCEGCGTCINICSSNAIAFSKNGLAQIDSSKCITCGYCAQGCPVRAIIMY